MQAVVKLLLFAMAIISSTTTPNAHIGDTTASKPGFVIAAVIDATNGIYRWDKVKTDLADAFNVPEYVTAATATIQPYNDGKAGVEGKAYFFDAATVTDITLSDPATNMDVSSGLFRWVISMDWAVHAARTTPVNLITGTATLISNDELPDSGDELISIAYAPAGFPGESTTESVKIVSRGDIAINSVLSTYNTTTDAIASTALIFQSDGSDTGATGLPAGLYRKETATSAPIFIG